MAASGQAPHAYRPEAQPLVQATRFMVAGNTLRACLYNRGFHAPPPLFPVASSRLAHPTDRRKTGNERQNSAASDLGSGSDAGRCVFRKQGHQERQRYDPIRHER